MSNPETVAALVLARVLHELALSCEVNLLKEHTGDHDEDARDILAAMPDYTLVRKAEIERLRAALKDAMDKIGPPHPNYDFGDWADAYAILRQALANPNGADSESI